MTDLIQSLGSLLDAELPLDVIANAGGGEYLRHAITVEEIAPFACYGAVALAMFVQLFIPLLRRLYAACFRFGLDCL